MPRIAIASIITAGLLAQAAHATVIYNNLPNTIPPNVTSIAAQATGTSQFGNAISFAGTDRDLTSITILMSDWADQIDYPTAGDATGYDQDITVNLYNPATAGVPGSLIATRTQTVHVPWHDIATGSANGNAFTAAIDFTGVAVPDSIVYGVGFNTQTYGATPTGVAGPFNELNYGLLTSQTSSLVGTDLDPSDIYIDSATTYYTVADGFSESDITETDWTGFTPSVQFNAVPEPTSMALIVLGGIALLRRRRTA